MVRKTKPTEPPEDSPSDFVPAVFARSVDEAEDFRALLDDHDIPAVIASDDELSDDEVPSAVRARATSRGVAVMVPEVLLDEASEIIADREDDEEFRTGDEFDDETEDDEDETADLGIDGELVDEEMDTPLPLGLSGASGDEDDQDELDDELDMPGDFLDDDLDEEDL